MKSTTCRQSYEHGYVCCIDTINHGIMLDVFQRRCGVGDAAVDWFAAYFADRTQQVITSTDSSSVSQLPTGTPQHRDQFLVRSALSPTLKMAQIFSSSIAFYILCSLMTMHRTGHGIPSRVNEVAAKLRVSVSVVINWCVAKRLQLNTIRPKSWFGSATNLSKL